MVINKANKVALIKRANKTMMNSILLSHFILFGLNNVYLPCLVG